MVKKSTSCTPDIWGGIECSYNRVGDQYMDQLSYNGHYNRAKSDILLFASLGLKAMRYPLIWEKHQPSRDISIDWGWTTRQLNALKENSIEPIAGLMHHGSGPSFAQLLHKSFPKRFASYASQVAVKFPWLQFYTPINEPLTTARFSGLYGIWFPHKKRDRAFANILFNQMQATVRAMQAIRKVNPSAKLIQTEDLCKTYSTTLLQYQADFENERRWLTYDILCGFLDEGHALWDYFKWLKVPEHTLRFFQENQCPPDLIGADHYLTSERFLDQHLKEYPHHYYGGNHKHRYADVEAIRVKHPEPFGLKVLLKECWERYKIPIAMTEVHINGSTNDQIRWFKEVWDIAKSLNNDGIQIPAVTAWALLGSFGWNKLLTVPGGHYESGAFNLVNNVPVATELVEFVKRLSENTDHTHPALNEKAWWQREDRCVYNVDSRCKPATALERAMPEPVLA
jgi:dTDP-4-dehydrorhamnose reductase